MITRKRYAVGNEQTNIGHDYTDEEREFMVAVERAMRRAGVKFPTCRLVLDVAKSLGYRKVAPPQELPRGVRPD